MLNKSIIKKTAKNFVASATKLFKPVCEFAFDPAYERKRLGVLIVALIVFSLFGMYAFFPRPQKPQIAETNIIKTATIKQTSAIVASQPSSAKGFGRARPVKYSVIVKRRSIPEKIGRAWHNERVLTFFYKKL